MNWTCIQVIYFSFISFMYSLRLLQQQRSRDIIHKILLAMKYTYMQCIIYVLEPSYMCSIIRVIYCDVLNGLRYCAIGSLWLHSFLNLNILTIQCGSRSIIWIYCCNHKLIAFLGIGKYEMSFLFSLTVVVLY